LKHASTVVAGLLASGGTLPSYAGRGSSSRIPLVHITDLYHPPQDPDDHFDLATVVALPEFDLRGVILDVTQKFLDPAPAGWDIARDPGYIPVVQLVHILGRSLPVAAGPVAPLDSVGDDLRGRPAAQQAGVTLLLELLDASPEPVVLSLVGSARVVAAAYNRAPDLLRRKTAVVVLNAGSTGGPKKEWNVGLDPSAYVCLWRSGLPIHWYPCGTPSGAFDPAHERGTYWRSKHATMLHALSPSMQAWFANALSECRRGDIIQLLAEGVDDVSWKKILQEDRNMWSTASLIMAAGRALAHTRDGWRFVPARSAGNDEVWPWRLDPISASVDDTGVVTWALAGGASRHRLFGRKSGPAFGAAMGEALGALLGTIR
jgi:hypothetical protein